MYIMRQILSSSRPARPARIAIFGGILLILGSLLSGISPAHAKYASIIIDANSGKILHQVNADTRNYPASLTKMMTLYMVFEALERGKLTMNSKIRFSKRAASRPQTKLGVRKGASITVKQAISALVVRSANDVATAVAEHLGKTESGFARLMTRKAKSLGMSRTVFRNASGLPNRGQLSTARDMATLVRALQRHYPEYYGYFALKRFSFQGRTFKSHNKLLGKYDGSDGVKTGYTRASGFNLASSVERGSSRLIGVVFGGKSGRSRDKHMRGLLDKGFARIKAVKFAAAPIPPYYFGKKTNVASKTKETKDNVTEIAKATPEPNPEPNLVPVKASETVQVAAKSTTIKPPVKKAAKTRTDKPQAQAFAQASAKAPIQDSVKASVGASVKAAPPLPKAYGTDGLARTIIVSSPQRIALVQNFKTGNPDYDGGGWSVQVGAYHRLEQATDFFAKLLSGTAADQAHYEKVILSQVNKKGSIYKPRLVGMKKSEAYAACKLFKAKKIDCLVISPNAG